MNSISRQPRKQRKSLYIAPLHKKRKAIAAHMADDLMLKYRRRTFPVIRGDTVKIMRGEFKGHVGKVRSIYTGKGQLEIEGVIITKVDGKKVPRPVHASNVLLTKLNLADPWRRQKLEEGLPEEVKKEIEKEAQAQIEEQERMAAEEMEEEAAEEPEEGAEETIEEEVE
ncbi:MAG: 50S ribosomal protein L24, partial [Thermoplasmata archaeon]